MHLNNLVPLCMVCNISWYTVNEYWYDWIDISWFWSFCGWVSETVVLFAQVRGICMEENVKWTSKSILWHASLSSSSLEYGEICFRIEQRFAGLSVMCLCHDRDIRSIWFLLFQLPRFTSENQSLLSFVSKPILDAPLWWLQVKQSFASSVSKLWPS